MQQVLDVILGNVETMGLPIWGNVILFAVGFLLLIKGGDWFVDGAESMARRFGMPELLVGATVVAIGTTLPEVMVSAQGAMAGNGAIAFGNAIGSIVCNTALIAAITLVVKPAVVDRKTIFLPAAAFFIAAAYYVITAYLFGEFSLLSGITLLVMFVIYMVVTVMQMRRSNGLSDKTPETKQTKEEVPAQGSVLRDIFLLVVGALVIALGARQLVGNTTILAKAVGVPDSVIALTLVALGTSLPELVTAITALAKGHGALSLGNIIGANLFNLVLVSGVAITITPDGQFTLASAAPTAMTVDIPVALGAMALLTLPPLITQKLSRWQGAVLLCGYVAYCAFLVVGA